MQLKHLTISALVAAASAQSSTQVSSSTAVSSVPASGSINTASVLEILATAVPTSLAALYLTNSPSAEMLVASQLSVGSTPAWFQNLPTPVQTYLLGGAGTNITTGGNGTMGYNSSAVVGVTTRTTRGHTTVLGGTTPTHNGGGATGGSQTAGSGSSGNGASSSSTGGAAMPTAILGAGLAGAVGLVGLLAL